MHDLHPGESRNIAPLQQVHDLPVYRPEWYWARLTGLSLQAYKQFNYINEKLDLNSLLEKRFDKSIDTHYMMIFCLMWVSMFFSISRRFKEARTDELRMLLTRSRRYYIRITSSDADSMKIGKIRVLRAASRPCDLPITSSRKLECYWENLRRL